VSTETIVCAINESTGAGEALRAAARLAARLDMRLVAVHVVEDAPLSPAARREARAGGMRLVDRVLAEQAVPVADRRVAIGDPAEHVGRIADEEGAQLIVVGSTPHGRRQRPPLRSRLATELPRVTPVPVVVVPPQLGRPYARASSSLLPDGSVSTRPAAVSSAPAPAAAAHPSRRSNSSVSGKTIVA
jgi:nucleotide-binding universal stress UspA family protein